VKTIETILENARGTILRYLPTEAVAAHAMIIDLRSHDERAVTGIIPGSVHVPRSVLEWRAMATLRADSVVQARAPLDSLSLFRIPLPASAMKSTRRNASARSTVWVDVVPRQVGVDSVAGETPRMGVEVLEGFVPSYDAASRRVTLHADARLAARVEGERYRVLRDSREVRVLMTSGRTLSLPAALAELAPGWWQLDLLHGWLVVRR